MTATADQWADCLNDVADEVERANHQHDEEHEMKHTGRALAAKDGSMTESSFDALLSVALIKEKSMCEQKLGRTLTDAESLIFDSGFYSGVDFGLRDARRQFEEVASKVRV